MPDPGNELRVVDTSRVDPTLPCSPDVACAGTDVEACCGTHCDNTPRVGFIRMMKANRISDGIVRLEFVAGENALKLLNKDVGTIDPASVDRSSSSSFAERPAVRV